MVRLKQFALFLVYVYAALYSFNSEAQHKVVTKYYPAFDSVGMHVPVELQYEVLVNDSTIKDGYWVKFSQEGDTLLFCNYSINKLHGLREEHYGDGHVKSTLHYDHGQRKDTAYFWDFNGDLYYIEVYSKTKQADLIYATRINQDRKIISLGFLKNDLADSTWKEFYPDDNKLKSSATFKEGKLNGWVETYYPEGSLLQKAEFKNQELDGKVLLYYPEGNLKSECIYKQGEQNGLLIEYYNDGLFKTKSAYKNNTLSGLTQRFYANGKLATEENYLNGVLFGYFKTYFDNGQLESSSTLEAGKKQGFYSEYNRNGILLLETGYKNGLLNGENKAYYETGTPLHTLNYKDGKKTGKNYYYYPKGSAKEIQIYEYTNEQSRVSIKRFYENEQLKENGSYSIKDSQDPNGWIKDGEWIGYFESGKLKYKELYLNGKKHLDLTYYFEKGLVQREEHYTHNLKQGRWLSYFEDGKLETEVTYKNNVLYGIYKEFYATGLLKLQGHYTGGKKTGDWKYHTPSGILEKTEHYKNDVLIKTKVIH